MSQATIERVAQSSSNQPEFTVDADDYARIGRQYEALQAAGLGSVAYAARDLMYDGIIGSGTWLRIHNERVGMAVEKLGKPFTTSFEYDFARGELVAENGEHFGSFNDRGLAEARQRAAANPQLDFLVNRAKADVWLAGELKAMCADRNVPVGSGKIVASACPNARELGIPEQVLVDNFYQPERDQAMIWIATKTETGLKLETINLFHAAPAKLAAAFSEVTGQAVPAVEREMTPWQAINFTNFNGQNMALAIQRSFDQRESFARGEPTYHGLNGVELERDDFSGAEEITQHPEFLQMEAASRSRIEEMARSLIDGQLHVAPRYVQAILNMKKPDGSPELSFEKSQAVIRVLSGAGTHQDFVDTIKIIQRADDASLWATMARLYYDQHDKNQPQADGLSSGSSLDSSIAGLEAVESQRAAGRQEFGCAGGGESKGLYDMNSNELMAEIFGSRSIVTNCPMCDRKGVTATIANGKITCGSCSACVDVCTGQVYSHGSGKANTPNKPAKKPIKKSKPTKPIKPIEKNHREKHRPKNIRPKLTKEVGRQALQPNPYEAKRSNSNLKADKIKS